MGRTGPALSFRSAFLGELRGQETRLVLDPCQAANQCSSESMERRIAAPFFCPPICLSAEHLGNYSLLLPHLTFCFQACFSPQSPLNKRKSALSWFPPRFPPTWACWCVIWGERERHLAYFSGSPNSTLNEIKTYSACCLFMLTLEGLKPA